VKDGSRIVILACEIMKVLCGALILVLLTHMQCGGSCYAPQKVAEPPCHQHASDSKVPPAQSTETCTEQSVIASKASGPCAMALELVALLPPTTALKTPDVPMIATSGPDTSPGPATSIVSISILRI